MDGYIKNQRLAIRTLRITMAWKYATTFLILIFLPVWLFGLAIDVPPEEWIHTEIVYSHISREMIGLRRFQDHVLNTRDGAQFVIRPKDVSVDTLKEQLTPDQVYSLVYSATIAGGNQIEALSDGDTVYQHIDTSINDWNDQRQFLIRAIYVTLGAEALALILIDRLWCKKEYEQIRKHRANIQRRKASRKQI